MHQIELWSLNDRLAVLTYLIDSFHLCLLKTLLIRVAARYRIRNFLHLKQLNTIADGKSSSDSELDKLLQFLEELRNIFDHLAET